MANEKDLTQPEQGPDAQAEGEAQTPPEREALEALEAELQAARAELQALKDKYLRLLADFDNYRKRTAAEVEAARRDGELRVLRALLPVLDDLSRALEHAQASPEAIIEGIKAVRDGFRRILSGMGVEAVPGKGAAFDPRYHEAIGVLEGEEDGRIAEVFQEGFTYQGALVRPARVAVTKKKDADAE